MAKDKQPVIVRLSYDPGSDKTKNLQVYVVDAGGKIVETAAFNGAEAALKSSTTVLEGEGKLYVGQVLPEGLSDSKKNERTLIKMNAYEAVKNFDKNLLTIKRLPSVVLNPFPLFNCLITGHVNKNFIIDGQIKNLPVCDLRVHICEVETELLWPYIPIYYRPIPDWVIQEIGKQFLQLPPFPHDPIGPVSTTKTSRPLSSLLSKRISPDALKITKSQPLPDHVLSAMQSGSVERVRQTMIEYHELLYPYFCLWPIWWPWIYTCDEETIVTTDCNGHFEMWENTFTEDGPLNIYVWIEANINGQWVTVYRPPLPCSTWWNYTCFSDMNITISDPRVQPCHCGTDGPADAVWFRSIGWGASALHIEQNDASSVILQGVSVNNVGCTNILGEPVRQFGSGLAFKLFCGADIFNAGVTHYRWKYTKTADANLSPIPLGFQTTNIIPGSITRPYLVKLSATHYETHYATLGAEGIAPDIAYRIPHQDITAEPLVSPADQLLSPVWEDIFFDSAYIDSLSLADGLYRFELELLSKDGAGHFHVVQVAKPTFQVSEYANILNSQDAPDDYLNLAGGGNALSMSFKVRIDNAPCVAHINEVSLDVNGITEYSGRCGFLHYTDVNQLADISFIAFHPRNFARFDFDIYKGNHTEDTGIHPSGYVISNVAPFTLSGGQFANDFAVGSLIGTCPQAAFSENLSVSSLATDGSNALGVSGLYHASDVNAFALSNT